MATSNIGCNADIRAATNAASIRAQRLARGPLAGTDRNLDRAPARFLSEI
jgi:hypothetical protein